MFILTDLIPLVFLMHNVDDSCDITLEQILRFTTESTLPLLGGLHGCVIEFSGRNPYPTASTCLMNPRLSLQHKLFVNFREAC